jgi:hypothetical protein
MITIYLYACTDDYHNVCFQTEFSPIENQAYSNNPNGQGRSDPFLPRSIQDRLERMGFQRGSARSSQVIDLKNERVRNVVTFGRYQTKAKFR